MKSRVVFSKLTDDWSTPKLLYDYYMSNGYYDPCPLNSNFNGLEIEWKEKNFINPPFSIISKFVDKAIEEHIKIRMLYY